MKLKREDINAALLLSWLKYTPVSERDIKNIKHPAQILEEKCPNFLENKCSKNHLKITKNQAPKKIRFLPKKSSGSSVNGALEASRSKDCNEVPKRVRILPSSLMNLPKKVRILPKSSSGSSVNGNLEGSRNLDSVPKSVKISPSTLTNLPKNPETLEASRNPLPKRVRIAPSTYLPKNPELPKLPPIENLQTLIGKCSNPFVKQLTKSDVDEHQGRLLLNNDDVKRQLLPLLNDDYEDLAEGIEVKVFDPMGNFYHMRFKTWGNYKSYVLVGSWRKFIKDHKLKENDCVTIWMFRNKESGELCFALNWRKEDEDEEKEEGEI
ncbi:B3 domain-containing protein At1g05920-like [Lycium ferocissimum]|uniref:B3 domain-containing protein At1g05920-like n=1 Tax=Lycium ferocissimum TaxID=112874 RepID=UPI002816474D|nr:B3 domain-containing protein At1g05920-like [Lycium ferocissimum]